MRKWMITLLALLLALPVFTATAEAGYTTVSCPEEGFSTRVNVDCRTEYVAGDGLYFHLGDDFMPYVLVSLDASASRVTDPAAYFNDVVAPAIMDANEANGPCGFTVHGGNGGEGTPVLEMQYTSNQGLRVHLLFICDVWDAFTVSYIVRYVDEADEALVMQAMQGIVQNFQPDANHYAATPVPEPAPTPAPSGVALDFKVIPIYFIGGVIGRCSIPADWDGNSVVDYGQSIDNPWTLTVKATAPDGSVMAYRSSQTFLEIVHWDDGTQHQEGVYNRRLQATMRAHMDAPGYCDWIVSQTHGSDWTLVEDNQYPEAGPLLRRKEQAVYDRANELRGASGVGVDWVKCSVCTRRYAVDIGGVPSYICVMAAVNCSQSTATVPGILRDASMTSITWDVPFCYSIICPQASWDGYMSQVFTQFVENTGTSDQFEAANKRLSTELLSIIGDAYDLSGGRSYSEDVLRGETASGDDYTDRYSDYLFDNNDYTLSDGSHVKVSTAYDYVYEGDNGTVYYTDSAFPQPGEQLYPNR